MRAARPSSDRGAVTAELAVGLPVLVVLLLAVLTLGAASSAHLRALDAARASARSLAIGQSEEQAAEVAMQVGGADISVAFDASGEWVTVTVSKPVVGGVLARLPLRADASATAWVEP